MFPLKYIYKNLHYKLLCANNVKNKWQNYLFQAFVFFLVSVINICINVSGQEYIHINSELNLRFEKSQYLNAKFHSGIKPYNLPSSFNYDSIYYDCDLNISNQFLSKIVNNDLIEIKKKAFSACLNPIITIAPKFHSDSSSLSDNYQFGVWVKGKAWKNVAFSFNALYGIKSFPQQIRKFIDSTKIIPGYHKYFKSNGRNYHYFDIGSYLSYSPVKYLNLQAGIGKHFWGDGYRSLFLSDNSGNYPYFKTTVDISMFKYIWMIGALKDYNSDYQLHELKKKLLFTHFLSWNVTKWLNLNVFESIVSSPVDSVRVNYFNVNYLNPVIFLRPIEFAGGSADNALLGFGGKIKIKNKYQIYGQLIIDEFVLSEITARNNWWGNKYGIQAGIKIFDLFTIKNFFGRLEYNQVRPYTYSYSNSIMNYGNHFQALAHPSGANFKEIVAQLNYHFKRFSFKFKALYSEAGMDTDNISYGKNIYKSYELRLDDYGNQQGQGLQAKLFDFSSNASWIINPKMNLKLNILLHLQKFNISGQKNNNYFISLGISSLFFSEIPDFL